MENNKIGINNNFSIIRLMAAFLVFAGHMYVLMGMGVSHFQKLGAR